MVGTKRERSRLPPRLWNTTDDDGSNGSRAIATPKKVRWDSSHPTHTYFHQSLSTPTNTHLPIPSMTRFCPDEKPRCCVNWGVFELAE